MLANGDSNTNSVFSSIAGRYDFCNTILSFGLDAWWRRLAVRLAKLKPGERILDLCCGTGAFLPLLTKQAELVVGADLCPEMLEQASKKYGERANLTLMQVDALQLPYMDSSFDLITVGFGVRNFSDFNKGLTEMARVLKPGGRAVVLEFGQPENRILETGYQLYSRFLLPLIGKLITGNKEAYSYLSKTSLKFPCGSDFKQSLDGTAFEVESMKSLVGGVVYIYVLECL